MTRRKLGLGMLILTAALVFGFSFSALAQEPDPLSPVGLWRTVDDETGKAKSLVKIWEKNGKLYGRIVKLINPDDGNANPNCDKCPGALKDKPVVGMTIMKGLSKDGDEWNGGTILDPKNGKTYKVLIEVIKGGKALKVRGYIGFSLLGRTQYWHRVK